MNNTLKNHPNSLQQKAYQPEIAEILNIGMPEYIHKYGQLPLSHLKAVNALKLCRTAKLGGHTYLCDNCDNKKHVYNSCRNRHCPKCQGLARIKWVNNRMGELLPVEYFHAVFTIPSEINPFVLRNKRVLYSILQKAVSETLSELSKNVKHLGADIGFITVLHTWGQNLMDHPHVHCIIPGGGLKDNEKWKPCKDQFLFPIKVMSRLFKGKFLAAFRDGVKNGTILFHGNLKSYCENSLWTMFINDLYNKEWVVYCKPPFSNPEQVLKYLGGYTHRIAISNQRIIDVTESHVLFKWKDYSDDNQIKVMKLEIVEFIRRFLLHILPKRHQRIRYYGFLSNRRRKEAFKICTKLLGEIKKKINPVKTAEEVLELLKKLFGHDLTLCSSCKTGKLISATSIPYVPRGST